MKRHCRVSLVALLGTAWLTACGGSAPPPTLAPAPTFPVVTATAGPPARATPSVRQIYVVREGDTLSGISARFGVDEEAILKENPLTDKDRLYVGQELVIPPAQP